MDSLFILNEIFTNGYRVEILNFISIVSIICGILVIINKNPIVSVLFLFILMLINIRISELLSNTNNSIPLAIIVAIAFNYPIYQILPYSIAAFNSYTIDLNNSINDIWYNNYSDFFNKVFNLNKLNTGEISFVTSNMWDGNLAETSHITTIGNIMYSTYSMWLVITSIILLLAMVGSIVITIKQKQE